MSKLQYRHVRRDIENDTTPIHVHVDVEITKGKYADYDTFLRAEASEYLRLYLSERRNGSPDGRLPPENLTDSSPLIRDQSSRKPKAITPKQIRTIVHDLYIRAGLIQQPNGRMYDIRTHTLRKFFKTQLVALGVPESHADYMMGHVTDTYNDVQSLGVERLRQVYENAGLSIRPKTRISKIEALKEMVRSMGMSPEQVLTKEALTAPEMAYFGPETLQERQTAVLTRTLRELIQASAAGQMHA